MSKQTKSSQDTNEQTPAEPAAIPTLTNEEVIRDTLLVLSQDIQAIKRSIAHGRLINLVFFFLCVLYGIVIWGNQNQLYVTTKDVSGQTAEIAQKTASAAAGAAKIEERVEQAVQDAVTQVETDKAAQRASESARTITEIHKKAKK